ncbi:MAG: hypothetical protein ACTSQQ_11665, partial [Candidatus Helarchaeota archaeon]
MKKVLMICYDFMPLINPGSTRYSQFAIYLPDFGWEPIILTKYIRTPIFTFAMAGWLPHTYHIAKKLITQEKIDLIFTGCQQFSTATLGFSL